MNSGMTADVLGKYGVVRKLRTWIALAAKPSGMPSATKCWARPENSYVGPAAEIGNSTSCPGASVRKWNAAMLAQQDPTGAAYSCTVGWPEHPARATHAAATSGRSVDRKSTPLY